MPELEGFYHVPEELKGTILEKIMRAKTQELAEAKKRIPMSSLRDSLRQESRIRPFKDILKKRGPAVIAEIKKASPSAGMIREDFDPILIAREYEDSGAAALSVLTETRYFHGGLEILALLRRHSNLPLLRKDFIVDPYQILEARRSGADAVLLITALLDAGRLKDLRIEAERHGMEALVEVHNETELERALDSGAALIGVNNRDLRTFQVSLDVSLNLARVMPKHVLAVSESGIRSAEDVRRLFDAGYRGFLVGELLMRAPSPGAALAELLE